jgi:hypothetical protein
MLEFLLAISPLPSIAYRVYKNKTLYLENSMHVIFKETRNEKIIEILDDVNKKEFNI